MRRKRKQILGMAAALCMIYGMAAARRVQAASATITMDVLSEQIQVGDTFSVSVQLSSSEQIGEVSQTVQYDTEILQFATETIAYEENDGKIAIEEENLSDKGKKYILQFKAIKEGTARVEVAGAPAIYNSDGRVLSYSANSLSISVGERKEKSTNCNLRKLSVKEGALSEAFSKGKTEYTVNVAQEVKAVTVTAEPESAAAKVEVSGADKILVGSNAVIVKVTSEADQTKEYMVTVIRGGIAASKSPAPVQEEGSGQPKEAEEKEGAARLEEGLLLLGGSEQYELLTVDNLRMVPKGYLSVPFSIDGQTVDAYQLEDGKDQEFYLLYAKKEEYAPAFYLYDSREQTMQRYVENVVFQEEILQSDSLREKEQKVRRMSRAAGILSAVCAILAGCVVHFYRKSRRN